MNTRISWLSLSTGCAALALGCAAENGVSNGAPEAAQDGYGDGYDDVDSEAAGLSLRVDVWPATGSDNSDDLRALAQSLTVADLEPSGGTLSLPAMRLRRPGIQRGLIEGFELNPLITGTLPGQAVAVEGEVVVDKIGTVQSYVTQVIGGSFETWLVTDDSYQLTIVPSDPELPLFTRRLDVDRLEEAEPIVAELDIDIGLGVPLYGEVTALGPDDEPVPIVGAAVYAVNAAGVRSSIATTDGRGRYLLRVSPSAPYRVVCEGQPNGLDPVWSRNTFAQSTAGANVNFPYPIALARDVATGEVVAQESGDSISGTVLRLIAEEIDGFEDFISEGDDVEWVWQQTLDTNRVVTIQVVPGSYRIELLPPEATPTQQNPSPSLQLSSLSEGPLELPGEFGRLEIRPTQNVTSVVVDSDGLPVPGASVECTEVSFGGRSTTALTDDGGMFSLLLPENDVRCQVVPPGNAPLALHYEPQFDANSAPAEIRLQRGTEIVGSVLAPDNTPEPFAWVEVRDEQTGDVIAYGVSDEDGSYTVRAELPW